MNAPVQDAGLDIDSHLLRSLPLPRIGAEPGVEGRLLVVAGGLEAPGAAILTGEAALRAGAGRLQLAATAAFALPLAFALPEARVTTVPGGADFGPEAIADLTRLLNSVDAAVIGPGMTDPTLASGIVPQLLRMVDGPAIVLDAGAMAGLNARITRAAAGRLVLTPNASELTRLSGRPGVSVQEHPLTIAREVAANLSAVVVLKGETTHVVAPNGRAWTYRGETASLTTPGAGDVLAGVIGGLMARGADPAKAAVWAVWLQGQAMARLASSVGPVGFLARDLAGQIPAAMASIG